MKRLAQNKLNGQPALPEPEIYTPERLAEFFLSNAIDAQDYARAREEVRKLGLD